MSAAEARQRALQRLSRLHSARLRAEALERQKMEAQLEAAKREQRKQMEAMNDPFGQIGSVIGTVAGGALGALGGPAGVALGASLGGMAGGAIGTGIRAADSDLDSNILWNKWGAQAQGQLAGAIGGAANMAGQVKGGAESKPGPLDYTPDTDFQSTFGDPQATARLAQMLAQQSKMYSMPEEFDYQLQYGGGNLDPENNWQQPQLDVPRLRMR